MEIESNHQHIIVHILRERRLYVGMVHIVLAEADEAHALIMEE